MPLNTHTRRQARPQMAFCMKPSLVRVHAVTNYIYIQTDRNIKNVLNCSSSALFSFQFIDKEVI